MSTGGPHSEFRFYTNPDFSLYRIEFKFLDWYDGASRTLFGTDYELMKEIWFEFFTCGGETEQLRNMIESD